MQQSRMRDIKCHHHHRDAKRSAEASRRCDRSPERSVLRWLHGLSRCYTRDAADLVGPDHGGSTTGTSPSLLWWLLYAYTNCRPMITD